MENYITGILSGSTAIVIVLFLDWLIRKTAVCFGLFELNKENKEIIHFIAALFTLVIVMKIALLIK